MKIFITGLPGAGKTTLIKELLASLNLDARGWLTSEIRNELGNRVGFESSNFNNQHFLLAHKDQITSDYILPSSSGKSYFIDRTALEKYVLPTLQTNKASWFIFDEIGKMQLTSPEFLDKTMQLIFDDSNCLISILKEDLPLVQKIKGYAHAVVVTVDEQSYQPLLALLKRIIKNRKTLENLTSGQQRELQNIINFYLVRHMYTHLHQMCFRRGLLYLDEKTIRPYKKRLNWTEYRVEGFSGEHELVFDHHSGNYRCSCDLANNRNEWQYAHPECAHMITARLYNYN
ncbi:MAG TPA: nucleoside-triphosphatase [Vitreimonas sp.]|nr:nucleoside-triphosphatase [Vitreimonas sp.]